MRSLLLALAMVSFWPARVCCVDSQGEPDGLETLKSTALRVYIDCAACDMDFIKTEITFVNYVRERMESQVHILVTTEWTASGGKEYTIKFIGREDFDGMEDTLVFFSSESDSEDDIRRGIVHQAKLGLVRYAARTPVGEILTVSVEEELERTEVIDTWEHWVFSVSLNAWLNGEKQYDRVNVWGSVSAKRVTPDLKINLSALGDYLEDHFVIDEEEVSSTRRSASSSVLVVKSLGEHWSVGGKASISSSTYRNIDLSLQGGPAVELSIFPYSECTHRELRLLYDVTARNMHYNEETIFGRVHERLYVEGLTAILEMTQPWGSTYTGLSGSHYLHDFRKNNLSLYGSLSLEVVEGLSLYLSGNISMIHDQLSLARQDATAEEVYLRRAQLATQYYYWTSIGLSYTFGSIYSNVVNPRFG